MNAPSSPDAGPGPSPIRRFVVGPVVMLAYAYAIAYIPVFACFSDTADCDRSGLCGNSVLWLALPPGIAVFAGIVTQSEKAYRVLIALAALSGVGSWVACA